MPLSAVTKQRLFSLPHNALTNTYRHARASRVAVEMDCEGEELVLSITDDGVGMASATTDAFLGHGIRNMRRVERELGGVLKIESAPGEGTKISFTLPRREVANEQTANTYC